MIPRREPNAEATCLAISDSIPEHMRQIRQQGKSVLATPRNKEKRQRPIAAIKRDCQPCEAILYSDSLTHSSSKRGTKRHELGTGVMFTPAHRRRRHAHQRGGCARAGQGCRSRRRLLLRPRGAGRGARGDDGAQGQQEGLGDALRQSQQGRGLLGRRRREEHLRRRQQLRVVTLRHQGLGEDQRQLVQRFPPRG